MIFPRLCIMPSKGTDATHGRTARAGKRPAFFCGRGQAGHTMLGASFAGSNKVGKKFST